MSRRAKQSYHHLKVLAESKPHQIKAIVKTADNPLIHTLCECIFNLLSSNLPISPQKKRKLAKYKKHLIKIATKGVPLTQKRKILVQHGGNFLALLLPAASTVLEKFLK